MPIGMTNGSTTQRRGADVPQVGDDPEPTQCVPRPAAEWCHAGIGSRVAGDPMACIGPNGEQVQDPQCAGGAPPPGGVPGDGGDPNVGGPPAEGCGPGRVWNGTSCQMDWDSLCPEGQNYDHMTQQCSPTAPPNPVAAGQQNPNGGGVTTPGERDPYARTPNTQGNPSVPDRPTIPSGNANSGAQRSNEQQIPWWSFTEGGAQQPAVEQQPSVGGMAEQQAGPSWAQQAQQALMNSPQMWRWS